jgi:type II secretory pathway pseudopilin PulG
MQRELEDRYEPLPGLAQLPGFVWRRLPRVAKLAALAVGAAAVIAAIALAPSIQRSRDEHARKEAAERARIQQQDIEKTRREQRPRFARGIPARTDLAARRRLLASAEASIQTDASTRSAAGEFNGPIMRVECEGYPPGSTPPDAAASKRAGRYACLAVTSEVPATAGNRGGLLGHPYRVLIDFQTGRYAFCKVRGRPGELAIRARPSGALPRVCGG